MRYDEQIFFDLEIEGLLPKEGIFSITEDLKDRYIFLFSKYSGQGNLGKRSNIQYARKLAGLSLLKLNDKRSITHNYVLKEQKIRTNSGIVYLISNPAFPGYLKIGMTKDLVARLKSYQTYDPLQRYKVEHYRVVENARQEEKYYLTHHKIQLSKGEWVLSSNVREIFLSSSIQQPQ